MAEMKKNEAKETVKPVEKITAKADALKIEIKEPEKTPAVKAAVKEPAEKKAPAKKEPVKKETVKKAPVKKAPAKKTAEKPAAEKTAAAAKPAAKKAPVKKAAAKTETMETIASKEVVTVQFAGKSYSTEDLVKIAKDVWKYDLGREEADFREVELYVKPEESSVYYVINGDVTGSFAI